MVTVTLKRNKISSNELMELMGFVEQQETTDKEVNTTIECDGDYAKITLEFDEDGNITLL